MPGRAAFSQVGSGHVKALVDQHFGDATHTRAADSHEMHALIRLIGCKCAPRPLMRGRYSRHRRATRSAESGTDTAASLFQPLNSSFSRSGHQGFKRSGQRLGIIPASGISIAAPASTRNSAFRVW